MRQVSKVSLAAIATMCLASFAIAAKPVAPPTATLPIWTQDQLAGLMEWAKTNNVVLQIDEVQGGYTVSMDRGDGTGASLNATGDKLLVSDFATGAPNLGIRDNTATSANTSLGSVSGMATFAKGVLGWPLLWLGVALILLGVFLAFFLDLKKWGLISGVCGVAFLTTAFYPIITLFVFVGVTVTVAWPIVSDAIKRKKAEDEADRNREGLRAVVGGIAEASTIDPATGKPPVDPSAIKIVKSLISSESDERDKQTIEAIKIADRLEEFAKVRTL